MGSTPSPPPDTRRRVYVSNSVRRRLSLMIARVSSDSPANGSGVLYEWFQIGGTNCRRISHDSGQTGKRIRPESLSYHESRTVTQPTQTPRTVHPSFAELNQFFNNTINIKRKKTDTTDKLNTMGEYTIPTYKCKTFIIQVNHK